MKVHKVLFLNDTCTGCFSCANSCPKNAIILSSSFEGFYYPQIDATKCIDCGLCDKVCPVLNHITTKTMQYAYYGWSKDESVSIRRWRCSLWSSF